MVLRDFNGHGSLIMIAALSNIQDIVFDFIDKAVLAIYPA